MNNYGDLGKILRHIAIQQAFENVARNLVEAYAMQKLEDKSELRQLIECNPNIETAITDMDMLLFRIDMALDNRDEVEFDLLVQELEEIT